MNKKVIELRRNLTAKLKEARELIDAGNAEYSVDGIVILKKEKMW